MRYFQDRNVNLLLQYKAIYFENSNVILYKDNIPKARKTYLKRRGFNF
jgi:hypothetical protein